MSNYLQIIFKCDLILQIFLYFRVSRGTIFRSMETKFWKKKHPPLQGRRGIIFRMNNLQLFLIKIDKK